MQNFIWLYLISDCRDQDQSCVSIKGASDGTILHENVQKNEKIKFYRRLFCRLLPVNFIGEEKLYGIRAYRFHLNENAFHDHADNPDTKCFCEPKTNCLRKGLGNISPCNFGKINTTGIRICIFYLLKEFHWPSLNPTSSTLTLLFLTKLKECSLTSLNTNLLLLFNL